MTKDQEIIWLAGFIDADGCIRLSKGWKNKKEIHSLIPQVSIHNICLVTLNKAAEIVGEYCPGFQTSWKKRTSDKHSPMYNINIMGIKRCEPFIKTIRPYLVTKALEADLLTKFMGLRLNAKSHNAHYSSEEYQIYFALKELKKSRHLRDFTPTIEEVLNQDKVRTNARALERVETSLRLSPEEQKKRASKLVWYRKDRLKK